MNFEVLRSTIHGQSLVSSRHFGPGELVIQDPILFRVATDRLADAVNTRADAMLSMQQLSPEVFNEAFASAPLRQEQLQAYSAVDATSDLNRFQIVSYDMSSEWSQRPEAFGYGELCTFLNHSCQSNLIYYWNPKEDAMQLRAVAQISPREELTVNYLAAEAWMTRAERQESLNRLFKIDQCGCSKCSGAASDASDARIREIRGIEQTLITFIQGERVVEDILNVAKTFIYQCELELNLQTTPVLIFPDQLDPRLVNAFVYLSHFAQETV